MTRERYLIIVSFLLFSIIFFAYYPPTYAIVDEAAYLSTAYALRNGTFYYDQAGINQEHVSARVGTHQVSRYPPGNSLLLLPFAFLNWHLVFVRGWLLVGIGLLLIIFLLRHYRLPETYALLFLLHPTILLYSRTVMSDLPASIFVLASIYLWLGRKPGWAGILLGLSGAIRFPNLLVPAALFGLALIQRENRPALTMLAGTALGVVPLIAYNLFVFGSVWGSLIGYGATFAPGNLPGTLFKFTVALMIFFPGMLIGIFLWPNRDRWIFLVPALATVLFYSFQSYFDFTGNMVGDLVMSLRYLLPVIPLLIVPYIGFLSRIPARPVFLRFATGALLIFAVFLFSRHQQYLGTQVRYQREFYARTLDARMVVCNKDIYELINPFEKYIPWVPYEIMRQPQPVNRFKSQPGVYLACLTRENDLQRIFFSTLESFPNRVEVYTENQPKFFSIWRNVPKPEPPPTGSGSPVQ